MIAKNHKKSIKFKFEELKSVDFSWDICPGEISAVSEPVYSRFLRKVYRYDPSLHNFDSERLLCLNTND